MPRLDMSKFFLPVFILNLLLKALPYSETCEEHKELINGCAVIITYNIKDA